MVTSTMTMLGMFVGTSNVRNAPDKFKFDFVTAFAFITKVDIHA